MIHTQNRLKSSLLLITVVAVFLQLVQGFGGQISSWCRPRLSWEASNKIESSLFSHHPKISSKGNKSDSMGADLAVSESFDAGGNNQHATNYDSNLQRSKSKQLIFVRHGSSLANEYMDRPGNRWGDPTFTDDISLRDSPLSRIGHEQADLLRRQWSKGLKVHGTTNTNPNISGNKQDATDQNDRVDTDSEQNNVRASMDVDLVVISPLTRAIQTYNTAVRPNLQEIGEEVTVIVHPLATERVYTASDTGRPMKDIRKDFPYLDFESEFSKDEYGDDDAWWFQHDSSVEGEYIEWRPNDREQFYACHGEPKDVFHDRMIRLKHWLDAREEKMIVLVTHWAVIRWFLGVEFENCEARIVGYDGLVKR